MSQPCHLISPATVPRRLSSRSCTASFRCTFVAQGCGAAPNSVPTVSAVSTGLDLLSPSDERLRPSGQASSGAHSYPAPTAPLRAAQLRLDAHLATRRSGDQCTRGPLQTPSDGATPRRTRTQSVLGEGFLSRSKSPSNRPKSFEIAAHCGGCMRRSGASDGGTKGALASLRKRPSARSMSLDSKLSPFFYSILILHAGPKPEVARNQLGRSCESTCRHGWLRGPRHVARIAARTFDLCSSHLGSGCALQPPNTGGLRRCS